MSVVLCFSPSHPSLFPQYLYRLLLLFFSLTYYGIAPPVRQVSKLISSLCGSPSPSPPFDRARVSYLPLLVNFLFEFPFSDDGRYHLIFPWKPPPSLPCSEVEEIFFYWRGLGLPLFSRSPFFLPLRWFSGKMVVLTPFSLPAV